MFNLVIFGAPGSGKGTQSELIAERYGLRHISTGEILRDEIARETELGKLADSFISKGQLIPDHVIEGILDNVLDNLADAKGVIFDGFPRTVDQAEALSDMLGRRGHKVDAVIGLDVDEDKLIERIIHRGQETGRADDNLETVKKRLDVYHKQTAPVRDYFTQRGNYKAINGSKDVASIFSDISGHLDNAISKN